MDFVHRERLQHSALQDEERSRPGPSHAFEESAAIDPVLVQVFFDEICHLPLRVRAGHCPSWEITRLAGFLFPTKDSSLGGNKINASWFWITKCEVGGGAMITV